MNKLTCLNLTRRLFLPLILLMSVSNSFAQEYHLAECSEIKVAGPDEWNPNFYFDIKSQSHQGLGYELLDKISKKQEISYQILKDIPWKRVLKYAEDGEVDIIVGIYKNLQREQFVEFSKPFFLNNIKIYVHRGKEFSFKSFNDLQGKKGLFPAGASYGDEFELYAGNLDLEGKTNIDELFMYLTRGTADYAIQESTRATYFLAENNMENDIVALPQSLLDVPVRFGYSRNSRCSALIKKFNAEYQQMFKMGELAKLQQSYRTKNL